MSELLQLVLIWSIPVAPLIACVGITLAGRDRWTPHSHKLAVASLTVALVASLGVALWVVPADGPAGHAPPHGSAETHAAFPAKVAAGFQWIKTANLDVRVDLRVDALTATMLVTVTLVSLLVAVYSSGYMHGDPGYRRFFAEFSLFVFSMCMLVLAGNFLLLFVFWEAVGLCSYLLIGFWFERPAAAAAAKKAFVVNRIGDFGFLLGLFLIWTTFGSLNYADVFDAARLKQVAAAQPDRLQWICLLLFVGAMGKSAQFPLHVWLPDAMEGPSPVSALIHAATMVTAGVYVVARCTPLFVLAPTVQLVVAGIGGITALLAALIALTQTDLKRVLAYSTVSQLGYMFLALGSGAIGAHVATLAVTAAMFHLFTHAFFKALLFLAAGSVMHAMGDVIDMRRFGGLARALPITRWTFLCGAAALAGVPLLSGFWSKDEILGLLATGAHAGEHTTYFTVLLAVAVVTAVLTAFYTFRAYFLTFHGAERFPEEAGHHPHESPPVMAWPLKILAGFAVLVGLIVGPTGLFAHYVERTPGMPAAGAHEWHWDIIGLSTLAVVVGIGAAYRLYVRAPFLAERWRESAGLAYQLSWNKFYLDELFVAAFVRPLQRLAKLCHVLDNSLLDQLVDGIGHVPRLVGRVLRPVQDGLVQSYALVMLLGVTVCLLSALLQDFWK